MTGCRSATLAFYSRHKFYIKVGLLAVLIVLYAAYFGYALYYEFGSESSVRLLWITCLVVAVLQVRMIMRCLRPKLQLMSSSRYANFIRHHHKHVNWSVIHFTRYIKYRNYSNYASQLAVL